jgi:hypothetical protein
MINGFPIAQIPIVPALLDSGQGVAETGSAAGTSFDRLLGSILANDALAQSENNVGTGATSNTFKLPSDLINALHASGLITQKDFSPTVDNSHLFGISELLEKVLSFLNQISDKKFAPLEVIFDLEKTDLKGIGLPDTLGQNISNSSAVVLLQESDLQTLLETTAAKSTEVSLPVLALFKGGENGADPFSLMAATLTLRPQEADSLSEQKGSSGSNELQYFLTFMAPSEEPYGLDQNSRLDNPDTEFKSVAARISELLRILAHFEIAEPSGNWLQELQTLSQATSQSGENSPVEAELTDINLLKTINMNQTETLAENASAVLEAVKAFLDKLEGDIPAETGQVEIPAADVADPVLEKKALLVLTNILSHALNQTVQDGDPERFREIISMFNHLTRLEDLSPEEQKATLDSLVKEINSLIAQASQQANAGPETLKAGNGNSAEATIFSHNGGQQNSLEVNGSGINNGQTIEKLFVVNSSETNLRDIAVQHRMSPEILSENENIFQSYQLQSEDQQGKTIQPQNYPLTNGNPAASGETGKTAEILAEAARKISSLVSSILENSPNSRVATETGANRYQAQVIVPTDSQVSGAGGNSSASNQSYILSANGVNTGQVPTGGAAYTPGQNSGFNNPVAEGMTFKFEEILLGSRASAERVDSASWAGSGQRINDIRSLGPNPLNSRDTGGAINTAAGLDTAEKISGVLSNVTVPVKIAGGNRNRISRNSGARYNATVEYVKLGANSTGSAAKGHSNLLSGLNDIQGEAGMEEMLEAMLGKNAEVDELLARIERGEVSDKVKVEQLFSSFRSELSSLRAPAQKADQAQAPRSTWPVNQAEVFEKIINAARLTRLGGTSEISMRLEPDHLGQMRVRLTLDENHFLTARIQVETQEARSLIEASLYRLKDSLAEQGLKVEKFNVDVRQDGNQEQSQAFTGTNREGGWRSQGGMRTEGEDLTFAEADNDFKPGAEDSKIMVNRYSYSTLEWVA